MKNFWRKLKGKKTHLTTAAGAFSAFAAFVAGEISLVELVTGVIILAQASNIRDGMATETERRRNGS